MKRVLVVSAAILLSVPGPPSYPSDNAATAGAAKVESGARAVGKSADEIGTKAAKAVEGAARDTGRALGRAWDDIAQGLRKAFK